MTKQYVKSGLQNPDDPMEFVLSTPEIDRVGDIVEQEWDLKAFRQNPIALYQHNHREPVGVWKDVRVRDNKLTGKLKLAAQGTSALIDTVRSLVAQGILKAVSVGFSVGDYERREDGNGYVLKKPSLHEVSLVSVPANASALAVAKQFNLSDQDMVKLFSSPMVEPDPLRNQKNRLRLIKLSARQHVHHQSNSTEE